MSSTEFYKRYDAIDKSVMFAWLSNRIHWNRRHFEKGGMLEPKWSQNILMMMCHDQWFSTVWFTTQNKQLAKSSSTSWSVIINVKGKLHGLLNIKLFNQPLRVYLLITLSVITIQEFQFQPLCVTGASNSQLIQYLKNSWSLSWSISKTGCFTDNALNSSLS